jgi:hypothetical protein
MKTYVGIVRDHSASMSGVARYAARDYNSLVTSLKEAGAENQIDTIVSVVECGRRTALDGAAVVRAVVNSNVNVLQPIPETGYITDGAGTPLWDSVAEIIHLLKQAPDFEDPEVTFLVQVVTDGEENRSKIGAATLAAQIRALVNTDRWTFTFRVPQRSARKLSRDLGLPEGNILEWNTSSGAGMAVSTAATTAAVKNLYSKRKAGTKSVGTFYADLSNVTADDVQASLDDISTDVIFYPVELRDHDLEIKDFIWNKLGKDLQKGKAFYQLTKTEKSVQDYKTIAIRDRKTGAVYAGAPARQMLGLPKYGDARLVPTNTGNFDVFIQSTSTNRKVKNGSRILYWEDATVNK